MLPAVTKETSVEKGHRETEMKDRNKSKRISRRTVVLAAGAAPLLAMGVTGARAAKLPQAAVHYQPTPKDGKQCDGCALFIPPAACKSVEGSIAPTGWCVLWVKKAA
jgi:hypothetical protein